MIITVRRETRDLIAAFNRQSVGRAVIAPAVDDGGPTVGIELSDDVISQLRTIDPDIDSAIAKLIWGSRKLMGQLRAGDEPNG